LDFAAPHPAVGPYTAFPNLYAGFKESYFYKKKGRKKKKKEIKKGEKKRKRRK